MVKWYSHGSICTENAKDISHWYAFENYIMLEENNIEDS